MNLGPLILGVLSEAVHKFGRIDRGNRDQVARWVQRRVRELREQAGETAAPTISAPSLSAAMPDPRLPSGDRE